MASIRKPEGAILLDLAAERPLPLALNETAATIWDLAAGHGSSPEAIVQTLASDFGLETGTIRADVHDILRSLAAAGCLEITESP